MTQTNEPGTRKPGPLLLSLAIPAIIAMLVSLPGLSTCNCSEAWYSARRSHASSFMALGQAKRSMCMVRLLAGSVLDLTRDGARILCAVLAEPVADTLAATITGLTFLNFYRKNLQSDQ